jgi:ankyrin repeat protein
MHKTYDGETPLHYAAQNGHLDVASLLLELGADITFTDWKGRTASDLAKEQNHVNLIQLLEPIAL